MKNEHTAVTVLAVFLAASFLVAGCSKGTDPNAATLQTMEKKLMQLKAENSNLHSRTKSLDDKLLVLQKKEETMNGLNQKAGLRTVKLSPSDTQATNFEPPVEEREISLASAKESEAENSQRPVLRLTGDYGDYDGFSGEPASPVPVQAVASRSYADIPTMDRGGDNLGVISGGQTSSTQQMDPMVLFHSAYRSYNNNDFGAALAGFSSFLQRESNHEFADNAMFWRGECYLAQGKSVKAVGEFERLIRRYPGSEKSASALYRIGFIYDKLNDGAKAREYYFKVVEQHPNTEAARKASRRMSGNNGNSRLVRTTARR